MGDKMKKISFKDGIKFFILIIFLLGMLICSLIFAPKLKFFSNFSMIRDYIKKYKNLSFLIFVLLQILQVVIFVLPGDAMNMIGGFVFGIYIGSFLSILGVFLGTIIAFYISRWLGYGFISKFIKPQKLEKINHLLNSNAGALSLFVICNLPFVPKDILMYCAGLTPVKPSRILTIYCVSRIPGIIIWTSVGSQVYNQSVLGLVITFSILALFLTAILLIRKKMNKKQKITCNG